MLLNRHLVERFVAQENIEQCAGELQSGKLDRKKVIHTLARMARAKEALRDFDQRIAAYRAHCEVG